MVGGLRNFELMQAVIQKGEADFVSLSRFLINEPNIINEWKSGNRYGLHAYHAISAWKRSEMVRDCSVSSKSLKNKAERLEFFSIVQSKLHFEDARAKVNA